MSWRILPGDAREQLRSLPSDSVQCVVTSPPYYGLRDYEADGQIGLEETPGEYVSALVDVFHEVRRVLRLDGTLWLNLDDSYQDKSLIGVPWMVASALREDGWLVRSEVIWAKPRLRPESVTDRPTRAHEQLFLLTLGPNYFYDADAVREEAKDWARTGEPATRNRRSVWEISTQPYPGAHFAPFPLRLVEPCVMAGSSLRACGVCGAPQTRVTARRTDFGSHSVWTGRTVEEISEAGKWTAERLNGHASLKAGPMVSVETVGWESACGHGDDSGRCIVLDPFAGSGTVGVVCEWLGRDFIGIELNPEYAQLAEKRIRAEGKAGHAVRAPEPPIDQLTMFASD